MSRPFFRPTREVPPGAGRHDASAALAVGARRQVRVTAARWESRRTARDFLDRHQTGARFAALPAATRGDLLRRLSAWAVDRFGSLDAESVESYSFTLEFFTY